MGETRINNGIRGRFQDGAENAANETAPLGTTPDGSNESANKTAGQNSCFVTHDFPKAPKKEQGVSPAARWKQDINLRSRLEELRSSESSAFQKFLENFEPFQKALEATEPRIFSRPEAELDSSEIEKMIQYLEEFERFCKAGDALRREFPQGLESDPTWRAIYNEDKERAIQILEAFSDMTEGGMTFVTHGKKPSTAIPGRIEDLEQIFVKHHQSDFGSFLERAGSEQGILIRRGDFGLQYRVEDSCKREIRRQKIIPDVSPRWKELKRIQGRLREMVNSDNEEFKGFLRRFKPLRKTVEGIKTALKTNPSPETLAKFQDELKTLEMLDEFFAFKDEMFDRFPSSLDRKDIKEVLKSNPDLVHAVLGFSDENKHGSWPSAIEQGNRQIDIGDTFPLTYEALRRDVSVKLATYRDSKAIEQFLKKADENRLADRTEDAKTSRERILDSAARIHNTAQIARAFRDRGGEIQMSKKDLEQLATDLERETLAISEEMKRLTEETGGDASRILDLTNKKMFDIRVMLNTASDGAMLMRNGGDAQAKARLDDQTIQLLTQATRELARYEALLYSMRLQGQMRQLDGAGAETAVIHRLNIRISAALEAGRNLDSEGAIALGRQTLSEIDRNAMRLTVDQEIAMFSDPEGVLGEGYRDWQIAFGGGGLHPKYYKAAVAELEAIKGLLAIGKHEEAEKRFSRFSNDPIHRHLVQYLEAYKGIEQGKSLLQKLALVSAAAFTSGLAAAALAPYLKGSLMGETALMFAEGAFFVASEKAIEGAAIAATGENPFENAEYLESLKRAPGDAIAMGPMLKTLKKVNAIVGGWTKGMDKPTKAAAGFVAEFLAFTAWEFGEGNVGAALRGEFDPERIAEQVFSIEGSGNRLAFLLGLKIGHHVMNPVTGPVGRRVHTAIAEKHTARLRAIREEAGRLVEELGKIGETVKGEEAQKKAIGEKCGQLESLQKKKLGILRAFAEATPEGGHKTELEETIAREEAARDEMRGLRRNAHAPSAPDAKSEIPRIILEGRIAEAEKMRNAEEKNESGEDKPGVVEKIIEGAKEFLKDETGSVDPVKIAAAAGRAVSMFCSWARALGLAGETRSDFPHARSAGLVFSDGSEARVALGGVKNLRVGRNPGSRGLSIGDGQNTREDAGIEDRHFTLRRSHSSGDGKGAANEGEVRYEIQDVSKSGTYVNGRRLGHGPGEWVALRDGDMIRAGETEITFRPPEEIFRKPHEDYLENLASDNRPRNARAANDLRNALKSGNPQAILKALGQLLSVPVPREGASPGRGQKLDDRDCVHHRSDPRFQAILADLVEAIRVRIRDGRIDMSERALDTEARNAGLGKQPDRPEARGRDEINGASAALPSSAAPCDVRRDRPEARVKPPEFPKAKAFFEAYTRRNFSSEGKSVDATRYYNPKDPLRMLLELIHPSEPDSRGNRFDPVEEEGFAEAVREVAGEVRRNLQDGRIRQADIEGLPLGEIPGVDIGEIMLREINRFAEGSHKEILDLAAMWRANNFDGPLPPPEDARFASRTRFFSYEAAGRGGSVRTTALRLPRATEVEFKKPDMHDGKLQIPGDYWLVDHGGVGGVASKPGDRLGNAGRFFFAVKLKMAKQFWDALTAQVLNPAYGKVPYQSKIAQVAERFNKGDAAVLYFRSENKKYFRDAVIKFAEAHPEFFHEPHRSVRPIFTAQLMNDSGQIVNGVSFGQSPQLRYEGEYTSFSDRRSLALERAIRNERLLEILGTLDGMTKAKRLDIRRQLIVRELIRAGVDPENPAFDIGRDGQPDGVKRFDHIFENTDQGRPEAVKAPAPPDGPAPAARKTIPMFPPPAAGRR